jgi:hypothetical protein
LGAAPVVATALSESSCSRSTATLSQVPAPDSVFDDLCGGAIAINIFGSQD